MRRLLALAAPLALAGGLVAALPAHAGITGCAGDAGGGDWRSYSHDESNTRNQPAEDVIDATRASNLAPSFVFDIGKAGGAGGIDSTPAVADGCLFVASNAGDLFALNADDGSVVWHSTVRAGMRGSPTVQDGLVFVNVNETDHPYTAAFDEATGVERWETVIDDQLGSGSEGSPVVFDGMVFAGVSGFLAESGNSFAGTPAGDLSGFTYPRNSRLEFRGAWVLLDEQTGSLQHKGYVIPDADFKAGYTGGGVWSTPAIDPVAKVAYVGSGNPFNATEHENTNSILEIDLDSTHASFGEIIGHYHGLHDQYADVVDQKPVCAAYTDVFTCENFDLDFGASPQLFTDGSGRHLVGDLQKSGVYHGVDAGSMAGVWQTRVGGALVLFTGNLGTASYDGHSIVVGGTGPGTEIGLDPATGSLQWVAPVSDPQHIQPTSTANGVAYSVDTHGILDIWDTRKGSLLQARQMSQDTGASSTSSGPGVAIARHTVYAPTGSFLVAYR